MQGTWALDPIGLMWEMGLLSNITLRSDQIIGLDIVLSHKFFFFLLLVYEINFNNF